MFVSIPMIIGLQSSVVCDSISLGLLFGECFLVVIFRALMSSISFVDSVGCLGEEGLVSELDSGFPWDLGTLTSPDIGGLLSVNGSNSLGFPEVGLVHGVLVLSRDLTLITIIVRNILDEVDAANGSDEAGKFEHY